MQSLHADVLIQYELLKKASEGNVDIIMANDEAYNLYLELKELRSKLADAEARFRLLQSRNNP